MTKKESAAKQTPTAPTEQSRRFIEAARELGCDESEERFNAALDKVLKAPAAPKNEKAKPRSKRNSK